MEPEELPDNAQMWKRLSRRPEEDAVTTFKLETSRLNSNFNPAQDKLNAFTRELLPIVGDYDPAEIVAATDLIILGSPGIRYLPTPAVFKKALDMQRGRRGHNVVAAHFDGWKLDLMVLRAWIMGYQLDFDLWSRVAPLRMKPGGEGRPPLREYDDVISAWLPKAQPAALAAVQDDLLQASGRWEKGESEDIARLRRTLHYDAKEMAGGLKPSERVDLIKTRAAEIQSERRRAGA